MLSHQPFNRISKLSCQTGKPLLHSLKYLSLAKSASLDDFTLDGERLQFAAPNLEVLDLQDVASGNWTLQKIRTISIEGKEIKEPPGFPELKVLRFGKSNDMQTFLDGPVERSDEEASFYEDVLRIIGKSHKLEVLDGTNTDTEFYHLLQVTLSDAPLRQLNTTAWYVDSRHLLDPGRAAGEGDHERLAVPYGQLQILGISISSNEVAKAICAEIPTLRHIIVGEQSAIDHEGIFHLLHHNTSSRRTVKIFGQSERIPSDLKHAAAVSMDALDRLIYEDGVIRNEVWC